MNWEEIYNLHYEKFLFEYGNRKFVQIKKILEKSKHTNSLMSQCSIKRFAPSATDLRQCVLSNLRLSFAKKPIELMAMTILLDKFHKEVNIDNYLISESDVIDIYKRFENIFTY